jgi:hypothetical protein
MLAEFDYGKTDDAITFVALVLNGSVSSFHYFSVTNAFSFLG